MKDKLGQKTMTKFVGQRAKIYSYLIDDSSEDKKAKVTKKCYIKRKLKFENYKNCFNLINKEPDIDKTYLYVKDPYVTKYQFLIKKSESTRINHLIILKLFLNTQMI